MLRAGVLGAGLGLSAAFAAGLAWEGEASACGGCVSPPPPPGEVESVITDEKMVFSISQDQTTLYDEIKYSGSPSSFAWVLPIKGKVTVGLSADILFSTIETLTATQVFEPTPDCPVCNYSYGSGGTDGSGGGGGSGGSGGGGGRVVVTAQEQVGPYETVQLHSSDGSALTDWLSSHGYKLPAADKPVVDAYVAEHFDFLALKLVPGKGVKAMQPVRVTSTGAAPSLPLHMVAVGTGPTTGITIWVFADGRWEPANFPTFTITDAELVWDWNTNSSNYESLRLSKETALGGRGWQIESSLALNMTAFENTLLGAIAANPTGPGLYTVPSGDGGAGDGAAEAGSGYEAIEQVAMVDLGVLFAGVHASNVRVTRMRSDVAHSALSVDMKLQAASDPSELTNIHTPKKQIGAPPCYCPTGPGGQGGSGHGGSGGVHGGGVDGGGEGANPSGTSAGGCNTTGSAEETGTTVLAIAGMAGLVLVRVRRRERARARRDRA